MDLFLFERVASQPVLDPADCENEWRTKDALDRAGVRMRQTIMEGCTDGLLNEMPACAETVDGLVNAVGDGGCLVDKYAASVDALLVQQYGRSLLPDETELRQCQEAVARASLKYVAENVKAIQHCWRSLAKGKQLFFDEERYQPLTDPADCPLEFKARLRMRKAAEKMRKVIVRPGREACTNGLLIDLGSCASTVDGICRTVTSEGCLIESHTAEVDALAYQPY